MKAIDSWRPTKYDVRGGVLRASRDKHQVRVGSRRMGDLVAACYQRSIPKYVAGDLVDLGCGRVPFYGTYRAHVRSVVCVDWPSSTHPCIHLDLECDLTKQLPFADSSFDTIIISDVLEHIPNPDLVWHEIARILRPGGYCLINTPFLYCLHEVPHDYHRYTEHAFRYYAEGNALSIIEIDAIGGSVDVIADFLAKHLQFIPVIGEPLSAFTQWTAAAFTRSRLGKKVADATKHIFPLGYFLVCKK